MLTRLFGIGRTSGATEKLNPTACPGVGYGSCPTISTRTSWNGCLNARSTCSPAGRYVRPAAISARRNSPIAATCGATGSRASAQPASTMSCSGRAVTAGRRGGHGGKAYRAGPGSPERVEPPQLGPEPLPAFDVGIHHQRDVLRAERLVLPGLRGHAERDLAGLHVRAVRQHRARADHAAVF